MVVMTLGTFDLPHYGHANLLTKCAQLAHGETFIVGLNTDEFVKEYKGSAPIMTYEERKYGLLAFGKQTTIWANESAGRELIEVAKPNIIVIGSDWASRDYLKQIDVTQEWLDEKGISIIYVPYTSGVSTTELKKRITGDSRAN